MTNNLLENLKKLSEVIDFEIVPAYLANTPKELMYTKNLIVFPNDSIIYRIPSIEFLENLVVEVCEANNWVVEINHYENWWYGVNEYNDEEGFCSHCYATEVYFVQKKHPDRLTALTALMVQPPIFDELRKRK